MSNSEDAQIKITCPNCRKDHVKKLSWLRSHKDFSCTCGVRFECEDLLEKTDINKIKKSFLKGIRWP